MITPDQIATEIQGFIETAIGDSLTRIQRNTNAAREPFVNVIRDLLSDGDTGAICVVGVDPASPSDRHPFPVLASSITIMFVIGETGADNFDPMSTIDQLIKSLDEAFRTKNADLNTPFTYFQWDGYPPHVDTDKDNPVDRGLAEQQRKIYGGMVKYGILTQ
jgi:hypothetical protein